MRIGLIGHSHSVCLMDALGKWRDQLGETPRRKRDGYADAYGGWDEIDTSKILIRLPGRRIGRFTADLVCAVIFGGSDDYELVGASVGTDKSVTIFPTETLAKICAGFADCDLIVSVVFGNELAPHIWTDDLPAYDFIEESLPGPLRPGAQPIDRRYIGSILHEYASRVQATCLMMRRLCPRAGIAHVMPPPPLEDPSRLKFLEGFDDAIAKAGLLDARLRQKWYRAYAAKLKALLYQGGIALVPPPPAAVDGKGFFREYLSNGLTHGNATYGGMVWESVAANINVTPVQ